MFVIASAARSRLGELNVSSAGTHALTEHPIEPYAAQVLEKLGGDTSNFAARQLTRAIAADADLVLTMTKAHRDDVLKLAPQKLHRTFTLEEAARLVTEGNARNIADLAAFRPRFPTHESLDIPDPMGHDASFFATVGARIAELVPPILELCRSG
jgi:protein-tyrosine phosphatase